MANQTELAFNFLQGGMNAALDPVLLGGPDRPGMVARLVNGRLEKQLPRSRHGVIERRVTGEVLPEWERSNHQGATYYNPAHGLGGGIFGEDLDQIVESSGGRKYSLLPVGRSRSKESFFVVSDITGPGEAPSDLHLAWLCQAEPYVICSDGLADTWIWDGTGEARLSKGFNQIDKAASELSNAATLPIYANYRIHQVVNGRQIVVGDPLHRTNLSSPKNLLQTTEQQHLNTGLYFSPPAEMGAIVAAVVIPQRDNRWGNNEVIYFCEGGIFSVNTSLPDRTSWASQPLVKLREYKDGAAGPYAVDTYDHAAVFLSSRGIELLYAQAGSSVTLISPEVDTFLQGDFLPDRRFASLVSWEDRKLYCTVDPVVRGAWHSSRGAVVLNWNPTESKSRTDASIRAWEGLCVLPKELGEFVRFIPASVDREKRLFAYTWEPQLSDEIGGTFLGRKHLVEMTDWLDGYDLVLGEDGEYRKIRVAAQLWTKTLSNPNYFQPKQFDGAVLYLQDAIGKIDLGIYYRVNGEGEWRLWDAGQIDVTSSDRHHGARTVSVEVGKPRGCPDTTRIRYLQVMIRWIGAATIQGFVAMSDAPETLDVTRSLKLYREIKAEPSDIRYDDYEAATNRNGWGARE